MTFYICNEDVPNSALYERRVRNVEFWGSCGVIEFPIKFRVSEYKRVTCNPEKQYTKKTSDWFKPTFNEATGIYIDSYSPMPFIGGWLMWFQHKLSKR